MYIYKIVYIYILLYVYYFAKKKLFARLEFHFLLVFAKLSQNCLCLSLSFSLSLSLSLVRSLALFVCSRWFAPELGCHRELQAITKSILTRRYCNSLAGQTPSHARVTMAKRALHRLIGHFH